MELKDLVSKLSSYNLFANLLPEVLFAVLLINYSGFVKASKMDEKIEILSETNNMCRSLVALCVTLLLAVGYEWLSRPNT